MIVEKVRSTDGTDIACWRSGEGSPLVLVHGTTGDHNSFSPVAPFLESRFSLWILDRRGRGESGDGPDYAFEREAEDVAAVVEHIGEEADLFGHSFGADVALNSALLATNLRKLVLYEPSVGLEPIPQDRLAVFEALVEEGDRDGALSLAMREIAGATDDEIAFLKMTPMWAPRIAAAHTLPRELREEERFVFEPDRFASMIVPTLLLLGELSPEWAVAGTEAVAGALPAATVRELEGQGHVAISAAPQLVATELKRFLSEV